MRGAQHTLMRLLFGSEPKLRRMMVYGAMTAILYGFALVLLWGEVAAGTTPRGQAEVLSWFGITGLAVSYVLVRGSVMFGIANWKLAFFQGAFAIFCDIAAYATLGELRGGILIGLPVIIVFCAFSLRPRQVQLLSAFAILLLASTALYLVASDPLQYTRKAESIYFLLTTVGVIAVTVLTGELTKMRLRMQKQQNELMAAVETIKRLATIDELTSLSNRRHMHEVLQAAEQRQAAHGQPTCVALLDIDHFKRINDEYGHAAGDIVLRAFAEGAQSVLRETDVLARWGGEEFLLLLPDTDLAASLAVLERVTAKVRQMRFDEIDAELRVTFSSGVVARTKTEAFSDAIRRADEAMYRAKAGGRDRVISA